MSATLPATVTMREARAVVQALEPALGDGHGALVIDAGGLQTFDSAAIAALLELRRQAQAAGRTLQVSAAPATMVELAGLYGVAELLDFQSPRA
ncbi:MAG TPA: STAS domain-containing protein [Azospira sp.]|nr:STAS domain-containing protein [Azospira sp.]